MTKNTISKQQFCNGEPVSRCHIVPYTDGISGGVCVRHEHSQAARQIRRLVRHMPSRGVIKDGFAYYIKYDDDRPSRTMILKEKVPPVPTHARIEQLLEALQDIKHN